MRDCPFCSTSDLVISNRLAYAKFDSYPVSPGHILVITRRHISDYFQTTVGERTALHSLVLKAKALIDAKFHPAGYNIGVNVGKTAGQTIEHVHIHLIPRYQGDLSDPRGGVRGVIPEKRIY